MITFQKEEKKEEKKEEDKKEEEKKDEKKEEEKKEEEKKWSPGEGEHHLITIKSSPSLWNFGPPL